MKVLITGYNGTLGGVLSSKLRNEGNELVMAGRSAPKRLENSAAWLPYDLLKPSDLNLIEVDTVYHLASSLPNFSFDADVKGTQRLVAAAQKAKVRHFIYISIVGIEKVPIKYYKIKRAAEREIEKGGVPYSILRATQFHSFFTWQLSKWANSFMPVIPKQALFQPVDVGAVADKLIAMGEGEPRNQTEEMGGPERISLGEAMDYWMQVKGRRRYVINVPTYVLGKMGKGLREGALTTPVSDSAGITWKQWVLKNHSLF